MVLVPMLLTSSAGRSAIIENFLESKCSKVLHTCTIYASRLVLSVLCNTFMVSCSGDRVTLSRGVGAEERKEGKGAWGTKAEPNFRKKVKNTYYPPVVPSLTSSCGFCFFFFLLETYSLSFNTWTFLISIFINQLPTVSLTDNSLKGSFSPKGHFPFNRRCFAG